ncbi:MAG: HAD family hydrolase [Candidatus Rokuibacteriota bacterium]
MADAVPVARATPQGLLFDFGGTLDADGLTWKDRFFHLFRAEGCSLAPAAFDPHFYAADDSLVGTVPATLGLRDSVDRLARDLAARLRLDAGAGGRVAARFVDDALARLHANRAVLGRLHGRYRLGVVSNFYGNLEAVCDDAGIRSLLDVIVDSARVGYTKPDARIFRCAVDALGLTFAQAIFVGDSPTRDMAGARAVGMAHVWLVEAGGGARTPCCAADRVIHTLTELEDVL